MACLRALGFLDGFFAFFGGGGNSCKPTFTGCPDIVKMVEYTRYYLDSNNVQTRTSSVLKAILQGPGHKLPVIHCNVFSMHKTANQCTMAWRVDAKFDVHIDGDRA